ncbi:DUF3347 domain-containing protein [Robiginitalea marina]|uniref:DUF3347 domain-containing protein n=1 Tax=Robiginitalea marina TaxID=2954105 RepID=A0ABT1B0M1_9FLAO|nr:DUF3347 domain-containing protein [Robiginitalea marina]MCO5725385.1 DUF3347 domain-containing protein [Robiginitalea marina]
MKTIETFKKAIFLVFFLVLGSCGEGQKATPSNSGAGEKAGGEMPAEAGVAFSEETVEALFRNYLALRDALVASDFENARHAVLSMKSQGLEAFPEIRETVGKLAEGTDLQQLRTHFQPLSIQLSPILQESLQSGTIYKQYCPMAFENQGAFWYSESQDILNPYYGSAMLRCGKVEETISRG